MPDDESVLCNEALDTFFKTRFLPYVISFYDLTVKVDTSIEGVLKLTLEAIEILEMERSKAKHFICLKNSLNVGCKTYIKVKL